MKHKQSIPSFKCYREKIIKSDLSESYFLDPFAEDMTLRDFDITKDEYVSASRDGVIT